MFTVPVSKPVGRATINPRPRELDLHPGHVHKYGAGGWSGGLLSAGSGLLPGLIGKFLL